MLRDVWTVLLAQGDARTNLLKKKLQDTEQKIEGLLDRIEAAETLSVVSAYEKRITKLEKQKLVLAEKLENGDVRKGAFGESFELTLNFLENPQKLWASGRLVHQQTVMKLAFADPPAYSRENGFSNPKTPLPFNILQEICMNKSQVADREGFEPSRRLPAYTRSRRAPSTTRPPVHWGPVL